MRRKIEKKSWRGAGGEGAAPPPQCTRCKECIADVDLEVLCFVVVVAVVVVVVLVVVVVVVVVVVDVVVVVVVVVLGCCVPGFNCC